MTVAYRSLNRVATPNRSTGSHGRTDGLTEKELQGRGDLSVGNARVARRRRGRHHPARPTVAWWVWALVSIGYAWLTWRMALIELPTAAGLGVIFTAGLAFAAGHLAGRGA